jgi:ferrous iron transport protein B
MNEAEPLIAAFAGNPNSGKSTMINAIAGSRLHVGNWPGVTVEKREILLTHGGRKIKLIDLPGAYSLNPYSLEETITRDYLIRSKPDVIINVIDSTNLERSLYLTMQLLEVGAPVVIALNMSDEAEQKGYAIDIGSLRRLTGAEAVQTAASKGKGMTELLNAVLRMTDNGDGKCRGFKNRIAYCPEIEEAALRIRENLERHNPQLLEKYPARWLSIKLIEKDGCFLADLGEKQEEWNPVPPSVIASLRETCGEDLELFLADSRYAEASMVARQALSKPERRKKDLTDKIDAVVLNRYAGIPIFLAVMWIAFKVTFDVSAPFTDFLGYVLSDPVTYWTERGLALLKAPEWSASLVTDGVIAGVGFVLSFVPMVFTMFFFVTVLEASGYMARAAFVLDRAMHAVGLHGKSFIPLILAFGCNVPAIYATRALDSSRDRALTSLLIPFMSCSARLPVYALFANAFFPEHSANALWSIYVLGIVMAVISGFVFKKALFKGDAPLFIMELPPYRLPSMRLLLVYSWEKGRHFLFKAGTFIFAVSILVWFFLNLPWGVQNKESSLLGMAGKTIAPALSPLGFGTWQAGSALITGFIAKEVVVGTMGEIVHGKTPDKTENEDRTLTQDLRKIGVSFGKAMLDAASNLFGSLAIAGFEPEEEADDNLLLAEIKKSFSPLGAYSFMAFVLLYMPCLVTAAAFKHELGSWKWFWLACAWGLTTAWLTCFLIYQVGSLLKLGSSICT